MADGLITDCRVLLSRFEKLKTVRFEKFCEVWREMNFSLIHWYACIFLMTILVLLCVKSCKLSCCSCSNFCDCFGCVLAVEGTATDEYRFELQPSCEILCVYLLIQLFIVGGRGKSFIKLNNILTTR